MKVRTARRVLGATLIVAGALLLWLAPESLGGMLLAGAGIALEVIGITVERR